MAATADMSATISTYVPPHMRNRVARAPIAAPKDGSAQDKVTAYSGRNDQQTSIRTMNQASEVKSSKPQRKKRGGESRAKAARPTEAMPTAHGNFVKTSEIPSWELNQDNGQAGSENDDVCKEADHAITANAKSPITTTQPTTYAAVAAPANIEKPNPLPSNTLTHESNDWSKGWDSGNTGNTTAPTKATNSWEDGRIQQPVQQRGRVAGRKPEQPIKRETMREAMRSAGKQASAWKHEAPQRKASPDSNAWGSPNESDESPHKAWQDPEQAVANMLGWDGKLLPPPVDGPAPYRGRHLLQPMVMEWMGRIDEEIPDGIPEVDIGPESKFTNASTADDAHLEILGDVVPRYWLRETVAEGINGLPISVQEYWLRKCFEPFMKDDDPTAKPFWQNWIDKTSHMQKVLEVPDARVDPTDKSHVRYVLDQGSSWKAQIFTDRKNRRFKRYQEVRAAEFAAQAMPPPIQPPPNPNRPKVYMFIRPVDINTDSDLSQITKLYNHYVDNSIFVQEMEHLAVHQMHERLTGILDSRMPVLVAIEKRQPKVRFEGEQPAVGFHAVPGEQIIGFGYIDELGPMHTMNQFGGDLEMFVAPSHITKGVGKNLLDRLLFCIDHEYELKGGCEWSGGEDWHFGGGRRLMRNIFCHMPYATNDKHRLNWVSGFFQRFGFTNVGDLPDMGVKLGQDVSHAILCYKTSTQIDATNPYC